MIQPCSLRLIWLGGSLSGSVGSNPTVWDGHPVKVGTEGLRGGFSEEEPSGQALGAPGASSGTEQRREERRPRYRSHEGRGSSPQRITVCCVWSGGGGGDSEAGRGPGPVLHVEWWGT